jgi:DNA-binding CsgD family transcriptional regulator
VDLALGIAQRRGSAQAFMTVSIWRALVAYRTGDVAIAEDHARRSCGLAAELGAEFFGIPTLVEILLERRHVAEAVELLESVDFAPGEPVTWHVLALLADRGRARVASGRLEEGISDMLDADERMKAGNWQLSVITSWVPAAALAMVKLGRRDEALELAAQELDAARAFGARRRLGIALSTCGRLQRGERVAYAREAVEVLDGSPARIELARALVYLGASLRQQREREQARESLSRGLHLAVTCGATALAEQAREELRATGARPRRDMLSGVAALTPAELRTARMAAEGLTNKQIAQALFVTLKTVEGHLRQAYQKLDIDSRDRLSRALQNDDSARV